MYYRAFAGVKTRDRLLLEQIVERLACVVSAWRGRLPLDRRARREQRARVARVFGGDARGDVLHALESAARIEGTALRACMKIGSTANAASVERDVR